MRQKHFLHTLLISSLVFLSACHGVAGNVIPQGGPSMETVYDSMGSHTDISGDVINHQKNREADLENIRQDKLSHSHFASNLSAHSSTSAMNSFHKLPNPELKLYIYPHFAGTDEIPIPGYYTAFNVYEKTHYALLSETIR